MFLQVPFPSVCHTYISRTHITKGMSHLSSTCENTVTKPCIRVELLIMFHFCFLWWRICHHGHWHCEKSMLAHSASLKRFSLHIFIQKHNESRRFRSDSNNLMDTRTGNENNLEIFTNQSIEVTKSDFRSKNRTNSAKIGVVGISAYVVTIF